MTKEEATAVRPWIKGHLPIRIGDRHSYGGEPTVTIPSGTTLILGTGDEEAAQLIAAAPVMLAALKRAEDCICAAIPHADRIRDITFPILAEVRAAIKEANGDQS